jgi:hypothetical protein
MTVLYSQQFSTIKIEEGQPPRYTQSRGLSSGGPSMTQHPVLLLSGSRNLERFEDDTLFDVVIGMV